MSPTRRPSRPARASTGKWLVKTEPADFPYARLEKEGTASWDGVRNALARIHLRAMRPGDSVLVYHTGSEKAVVGLARVSRGPHPDATAPRDPHAVAVDLVPVRAARAPVPMAAVRSAAACRDLALVRIPRLSVMPVSAAAWSFLWKQGFGGETGAGRKTRRGGTTTNRGSMTG